MTAAYDPTWRPGLAYHRAFDWLAGELHAVSGPVACLTGLDWQGAEILRRLPGTPFLAPLPPDLEEAADALGLGPVTCVGPDGGSLAAVAWIEPRIPDLAWLPDVRHWLRPGGRLYLVLSGRLGGRLVERRQGPRTELLLPAEARKALSANDLTLIGHLGLQAPAAIAWHLAGVAAAGLGQLAWRDRCHFAMRRAFGTEGPGRALTALACLTAEVQP